MAAPQRRNKTLIRPHPEAVVAPIAPTDVEKAAPATSRASSETPPPPYEDAMRSPGGQRRVREQLVNAQIVLVNTVCTVAIVFMNKT